ncbi:MAG: ATP-binding protein [Clostridia bacterium]
MKELTVKAELSHYDELINFINAETENTDCPIKAQTQISLAADEILNNIMTYAYENRDIEDVTVQINCTDNKIILVFIDSGMPFNPTTVKDPDITSTISERTIGGLGIYMVKKTMSQVIYENEQGKNILTLIKDF